MSRYIVYIGYWLLFCLSCIESQFVSGFPVLQCYSRYGEVISDLARFFRTERSTFPARLVTEQENNIGNPSCSQKIISIGPYHILLCPVISCSVSFLVISTMGSVWVSGHDIIACLVSTRTVNSSSISIRVFSQKNALFL